MPLDPVKLQGSISDILTFVATSRTMVPVSVLAQKWSDAFHGYMQGLSNPSPSPILLASLELGRQAMNASLLGMTAAPVALAAFTGGFVAYVAAIPLVLPSAGAVPYAVVLPLGPPPIALALALPAPIPAAAAAAAKAIDTWVRTGTATIPPAAPPPPWT